MTDNIEVRQSLCDLADTNELFCLMWKAITSVNITSLTPSSENPLIFIHLISKSLPTSATSPEGRRSHCLVEVFDPCLSFSVHLQIPNRLFKEKELN
ncbi:MAG: hypothetical protein EZS28_039203 [Streblomastix strix]|uniref:Uncharacterized protein n=1 Tax=Streblomastix strix TaxID=222440 RepID=A0A5J4U5P2_9EUKA|nr:MAG: hypothetical protein EZS28_039203 [Streblomastix strix]